MPHVILIISDDISINILEVPKTELKQGYKQDIAPKIEQLYKKPEYTI